MTCEFCNKSCSLNRRKDKLVDVLEQLKSKRGFLWRGWDANNLCLPLKRKVHELSCCLCGRSIDIHHRSTEMLWFFFFQMCLSVLTWNCSSHLPLLIVFFGKTFLDMKWLAGRLELTWGVRVYKKRWCTLFIPCEHTLGGSSFAVNTRIMCWGGAEWKATKKKKHALHGRAQSRLPFGVFCVCSTFRNDAVSWLKEGALQVWFT